MALTGAGLIYHLRFDFRGPVRHDLYCSAQLHVGFRERAERGGCYQCAWAAGAGGDEGGDRDS